MNYSWNVGWTLFTQKRYEEALPPMERTAELAPENGEVLYDLAVIRLAVGKEQDALQALERAVSLNPKLKNQAMEDADLAALRDNPAFESLVR